ncbi:hypothetical protein NEOLEDRAFT_1150763 [Neolentinus lepideus HHB14362 ss-1]|uniref:Uncharacterized protein n=1 Tax=Neolentinus lepideus HHB14362 ss-1 TaxID=1314782 RepID=A0A165PNN5_9AGAM|nr:hypothetical protein NEOLEDRAFT_1150763 [Neolentinus lepideus HHB14362 ss-1]
MSAKALSNGTLSLRFMQRAKLAQKNEAEKAEVKDESQWEISSEVQEAWGLSSGSSQPFSEVTYESSYLPFLFPAFSEDPSASTHTPTEPKGRRKFNAKGQEVAEEPSEPVQAVVESANDTARDWSKMSKRPATISGSSGTISKLQKGSKKNKDNAKSAKTLIRETAKVGTDLRAARSSLRAPAMDPPAPTVFLKPSGVDEPAAGPSGSKPVSSRPNADAPSRNAGIKGKAKRVFAADGEPQDDGAGHLADKKRLKKKKHTSD